MTEMSGRASARASGRALISATMSDIEVEATVKPALSEESLGREASYREIGQLNLEVLDLRKLDPDINGDGKISSEEKTIYKMLMDADTDGDGKLNVSEVRRAPQPSALCVRRRPARTVPKLTSLASGRGSFTKFLGR